MVYKSVQKTDTSAEVRKTPIRKKIIKPNDWSTINWKFQGDKEKVFKGNV
jgi:hypothetical protein